MQHGLLVYLASSISSGTARILVKPFLNTTKTRFAPLRSAEVAQSKAVSPAPRTITVPYNSGNRDLHAHIPGLEALATCKWQGKQENIYLNVTAHCTISELLCWELKWNRLKLCYFNHFMTPPNIYTFWTLFEGLRISL